MDLFIQPQPVRPGPAPLRSLGRTTSGAVGSTSTVKRTYGAARSFKPDVQEDAIFARQPSAPASSSPGREEGAGPSRRRLGLPALPKAVKDRESYATLRKRFGADDDEELEESQRTNELKSVTQQRAKGENSRFQDEFSFLTEGLTDDQPIGVRRSR